MTRHKWYVSEEPVDVMKISEFWFSPRVLGPRMKPFPAYIGEIKKMVSLCREQKGVYIPPLWLKPEQAEKLARELKLQIHGVDDRHVISRPHVAPSLRSGRSEALDGRSDCERPRGVLAGAAECLLRTCPSRWPSRRPKSVLKSSTCQEFALASEAGEAFCCRRLKAPSTQPPPNFSKRKGGYRPGGGSLRTGLFFVLEEHRGKGLSQ